MSGNKEKDNTNTNPKPIDIVPKRESDPGKKQSKIPQQQPLMKNEKIVNLGYINEKSNNRFNKKK